MDTKPTYEELEQRVEALEREVAQQARIEEQLRLLSLAVEQSSEGIAIADLDGNLEYINHAFAEMHGYSAEELIGTNLAVFHTPEQMPSVEASILELKQTGSFKGEIWHVRRNGDVFPTVMHNSLITDEASKPVGMMGTIRDITESRQIEEALIKSEQSYRTLTENLPGMVYRLFLRENDRMEFFNDMVITMTGYQVEELIHGEVCNIDNLILPEDRPLIMQTVKDAISKGEAFEVEYGINHKNGDIRYFIERGRSIFGKDGKPLHIDGVILDQTARKHAEEVLKVSEKNYQEIFNACNEAIFVHDMETGAILDVNQTMCEMFGYTREEALKLNVGDLSQGEPPYTTDHANQWVRKAIKEGPQCFEWLAKRKDGELFWDETYLRRAVIGGQGCILAFVSDITDRKRVAKALQESEERYREIVEGTDNLVTEVDTEGRFTFVNETALKIFGLSPKECIGQSAFNFVHPDDKERTRIYFSRWIENKKPSATFENRQVSLSGEVRDMLWTINSKFDDNGNIKYIKSIARDITDRRQAEEALKTSERNYREIFDGTNDSIIMHDIVTGEILEFNSRTAEMLGYEPKELKKLSLIDISRGEPPYSKQEALQWIRRAVEEGPQFFEWMVQKKNGEFLWVEVNLKRTIISGQDRLLAVSREITDRKQAEEALRESEEKYRKLVESTQDWVWTCDVEGRHTFSNRAIKNLLGYEIQEVIGAPAFKLMHIEERQRAQKLLAEAVSQKRGWEGTVIRWQHKNGSVKYFETKAQPILDDQGNLVGFSGIDRDITERKRIEEEFQKEREFTDLVLSSLPGIFYLFDENGNINRWNKNFEIVTGFSSDEVRDMKPTDFFAGDDIKRVSERIQEVFASGQSSVEADLVSKDNNRTPHYFTGYRMVTDGKQYVLGIGIDISAQKRAEQALKDSEGRYRVVVEDTPAMICRFLPDGTLTFVNRAYCNCFGKEKEELIGYNFFQLVPPKARDKIRRRFKRFNKDYPIETNQNRIITSDGKVQWQEWTDRALFDEEGHLVEFQAIGRDITEVKQAQEEKANVQRQLQQAQKMEAIGTLAGGIAHDFNNILAAIIGYAGMVEMFDVPEDSPIKARIKQVLKAANRAKDLVQQILTFSRQTEQERQPVHLNYIVKEALKFLRASLPTTIDIHQDIADEEFIVMADTTQMHQILMNLCTNAGHAMPETGGRLGVKLAPLDLDAQSAEWFPELKPGSHLQLTVSDTGHGMTSEVMERIFDPFFTTKKPGEGTGMGLAVVHGIVKSHAGVITVDSELGRGTVFQIVLPRIEMEEVEPAAKTAPSIPTGTERILFIDDEFTLVKLVQDILGRLGYEVVTKTSSKDALELFCSQPDRFDLVITDQTMPHMTGIELAREMVRIRSDIPVILCTGYSETATPDRVAAAGIREMINKPLTPPGLAQTIRKVLDNGIND